MSKELQRLVEKARLHRMTPAEQEEQIRSFAYGNTHFENQNITRADIKRAADSLRAESDRTVRS